MSEVISVRNLKKSYGTNEVIKDLSFDVKKGEILCFLGPNGAGKSTTINILCDLLQADSGEVFYHGQPMKKVLSDFKRSLGVVPQDLSLYEDLSAIKNVTFFASLYGLKGKELKEKSEKALEFVGLLDRKDDKAKTFSGGMKRRLNIACAIAHEPELIIMDEPTVGIDPQSRNHILTSIKKMREKGMTILYTTHYMEEVEEISTRILIMDGGQIIAEGTAESLKEQYFDERRYIVELDDLKKIKEDEFYQLEGVKKVEKKGEELTITTLKNVENLDKIIAIMLAHGLKIKNLFCQSASLENVFLKLTGKSLRD